MHFTRKPQEEKKLTSAVAATAAAETRSAESVSHRLEEITSDSMTTYLRNRNPAPGEALQHTNQHQLAMTKRLMARDALTRPHQPPIITFHDTNVLYQRRTATGNTTRMLHPVYGTSTLRLFPLPTRPPSTIFPSNSMPTDRVTSLITVAVHQKLKARRCLQSFKTLYQRRLLLLLWQHHRRSSMLPAKSPVCSPISLPNYFARTRTWTPTPCNTLLLPVPVLPVSLRQEQQRLGRRTKTAGATSMIDTLILGAHTIRAKSNKVTCLPFQPRRSSNAINRSCLMSSPTQTLHLQFLRMMRLRSMVLSSRRLHIAHKMLIKIQQIDRVSRAAEIVATACIGNPCQVGHLSPLQEETQLLRDQTLRV